MKRKPFGGTGTQLPEVGQGTWQMEEDDRKQAVASLRRGLELGLVHVDTAEMYGRGKVESLVGEALAGRREGVYLTSKVLPTNATREGTVKACEASLRRLKTDHLDLYLLHWPGSHPLEGTVAAFQALVAAGKIRAWGVSNFDVSHLEALRELPGGDQVACNQVLYHLEERGIEHALLPYCEEHGVPVVGYSPFGSGHFPSDGSRGGRVLGEIAKAHGCSARAVALSFLTRRASLFAIPKAADPAHLEENVAGTFELSEGEMERISGAFPLGRRRGLQTL